jgi:hypothetical protein
MSGDWIPPASPVGGLRADGAFPRRLVRAHERARLVTNRDGRGSVEARLGELILPRLYGS